MVIRRLDAECGVRPLLQTAARVNLIYEVVGQRLRVFRGGAAKSNPST